MRIKVNKPKVVKYDMNTFIPAAKATERANIANRDEDLTELIEEEFIKHICWAERSIIREAEMGRYEVELPIYYPSKFIIKKEEYRRRLVRRLMDFFVENGYYASAIYDTKNIDTDCAATMTLKWEP